MGGKDDSGGGRDGRSLDVDSRHDRDGIWAQGGKKEATPSKVLAKVWPAGEECARNDKDIYPAGRQSDRHNNNNCCWL